MARRGRRGSLSPNKYFPATGDQMQITRNGFLWECAKSNSAVTPGGRKVRYAILFGFSGDSDEPQVLSIDEDNERSWLSNVDVIHRRIPGNEETFRTYDWNSNTETWQQRLEDS